MEGEWRRMERKGIDCMLKKRSHRVYGREKKKKKNLGVLGRGRRDDLLYAKREREIERTRVVGDNKKQKKTWTGGVNRMLKERRLVVC